MRRAYDEGFSLIELIIVIAIMAVLVAIIAPRLTQYLGKSKSIADKKNLDEISHQTTTCISEATIDKIDIISGEDGIKKATYLLEYDSTQGKVVANVISNGTNNFAKLLSDVFFESDIKSKLDKRLDKIIIVISGQQSDGYSVKTNYTS